MASFHGDGECYASCQRKNRISKELQGQAQETFVNWFNSGTNIIFKKQSYFSTALKWPTPMVKPIPDPIIGVKILQLKGHRP